MCSVLELPTELQNILLSKMAPMELLHTSMTTTALYSFVNIEGQTLFWQPLAIRYWFSPRLHVKSNSPINWKEQCFLHVWNVNEQKNWDCWRLLDTGSCLQHTRAYGEWTCIRSHFPCCHNEYFEVNLISSGLNVGIGVLLASESLNVWGQGIYHGCSLGFTQFTHNDIIGVLIDLQKEKAWVHYFKNKTYNHTRCLPCEEMFACALCHGDPFTIKFVPPIARPVLPQQNNWVIKKNP